MCHLLNFKAVHYLDEKKVMHDKRFSLNLYLHLYLHLYSFDEKEGQKNYA